MKRATASKIKIVGKKRQFSTGAQRQYARGRGMPVLISPIAEDALARHCEGGLAAGYEPRNWEKGIPLSEIYNSIKRHTRQEQEGDRSEDHACAAFWNWMVYIHTREMIRRGLLPKELDDMPNYIPKKCPKHPKYTAKKPPTNGCDICQMIYDNREGD